MDVVMAAAKVVQSSIGRMLPWFEIFMKMELKII